MIDRILAVAALLAAAPASSLVVYQGTATSVDGTAAISDTIYLPVLTGNYRLFLRVDGGTITDSLWSISGEQQILWWDDFGDSNDDSDNADTTFFTGNEYSYYIDCAASLASPDCTANGNGDFSTRLSSNALRIDRIQPIGYYRCTPTFTVAGDCAESFTEGLVDLNMTVLSDRDVGYTLTTTIPEPGVWALLIAGFGAVGGALRARRRVAARPTCG